MQGHRTLQSCGPQVSVTAGRGTRSLVIWYVFPVRAADQNQRIRQTAVGNMKQSASVFMRRHHPGDRRKFLRRYLYLHHYIFIRQHDGAQGAIYRRNPAIRERRARRYHPGAKHQREKSMFHDFYPLKKVPHLAEPCGLDIILRRLNTMPFGRKLDAITQGIPGLCLLCRVT